MPALRQPERTGNRRFLTSQPSNGGWNIKTVYLDIYIVDEGNGRHGSKSETESSIYVRLFLLLR